MMDGETRDSARVVEPAILWVIERKAVDNMGTITWSPVKMFAAEWQANHYIAFQPHHMFEWTRIRKFVPVEEP